MDEPDPRQREELERREARLEEEELEAPPRERRQARGENRVAEQGEREPAPEAPLGAVLHEDVDHQEREVEHRQLVRHLELEEERRVERDAAEPHHRHHREREQEPALQHAAVQRDAEHPREHHRQTGDRVEQLANVREVLVVRLAPVHRRGRRAPKARVQCRHTAPVYPLRARMGEVEQSSCASQGTAISLGEFRSAPHASRSRWHSGCISGNIN